MKSLRSTTRPLLRIPAGKSIPIVNDFSAARSGWSAVAARGGSVHAVLGLRLGWGIRGAGISARRSRGLLRLVRLRADVGEARGAGETTQDLYRGRVVASRLAGCHEDHGSGNLCDGLPARTQRRAAQPWPTAVQPAAGNPSRVRLGGFILLRQLPFPGQACVLALSRSRPLAGARSAPRHPPRHCGISLPGFPESSTKSRRRPG